MSYKKEINIISENPFIIYDDLEEMLESSLYKKIYNFMEEIDALPIEFFEKYQEIFNILVIDLKKDMSTEDLRLMFEEALTKTCSACISEGETK